MILFVGWSLIDLISNVNCYSYPRNLVLSGAPEALPSACENATASPVKSFNQVTFHFSIILGC